MRDVRRIHERVEYRLDRLHMIWLSLGAVMGMALMFSLGLVLGRRGAMTTAPDLMNTDPIARLDADGDIHKQLTFYDRLTAREAPAGEAKVADAAPSHEAPARAAVAMAPESAPAPAAPPEAAAPSPVAAAVSTALAGGPAQSGDFTVQVSAYQTYEEAKAYSAQLERKGFKPFIVAAEIKGKGTWYRVRIGSFPDEPTALSAKQVLARADIPAWVLRAE